MSSRNNRARTGTKTPKASAPDVEENTTPPPAQGLSFTVPTEFVDLPSRGLYYPANHALSGVESVEMRHMTAKEEDILASVSLIQKGVAVDRMLQSLIVDEEINVKDLLTGDRNALTVAARVAGYGADYLTKVECPSCNTEQDFSFDLDEKSTVGASFSAEELNGELEDIQVTDDGTFIVTLPKSETDVEIRLMTGADEEKLEAFQKRKEKQGHASTALTDTLKMIIIGANGIKDRSQISNFVDIMPALDSKYLRGVYAELTPNIDMTQKFQCSKCGERQDLEVPVNYEFFWPR